MLSMIECDLSAGTLSCWYSEKIDGDTLFLSQGFVRRSAKTCVKESKRSSERKRKRISNTFHDATLPRQSNSTITEGDEPTPSRTRLKTGYG